jgi:hypothetical protein
MLWRDRVRASAPNIRFTFQTAGEQTAKLRRPCFRKARGAPGFPSPRSRGGMLPHKCEGSGAPKGAGNIVYALRRTPNDVGRSPRGAPLRRFPSTSRPPSGSGQGRPYGTPLIRRAFTRFHPLPPARCRTDPCSWAGRCLPRPPEARLARPNPQAPGPFHHTVAV